MKMAKQDWWWIIGAWLIWRIAILMISLVAVKMLPVEVDSGSNFVYRGEGGGAPEILASLANFDGIHYLEVAGGGYKNIGGIQAFFPLWPLLIWLFSLPFGEVGEIGYLVGYLLNIGLSLGVVALLYYYVKLLTDRRKVARRVVALFLLFPTSFYLVAVYNESLFLCLLLGALIIYRRLMVASAKREPSEIKKWLLLGLILSLLGATRIVGVVLIVALLLNEILELVKGREKIATWWAKNAFGLVAILLGVSGLIGYMIYLHFVVGDALAFYHVQSAFGAGRSESIVLLPQVIWRYIKMFVSLQDSGQLLTWRGFAYIQEFMGAILFLSVMIWQLWQAIKDFWKNKIARSDAVGGDFAVPNELLLFSLGAWLVPTLTGNFSSMPRYVLVCLAVFIGVAASSRSETWARKKSALFYLWLVISGALLCLNTALFLRGYWVA